MNSPVDNGTLESSGLSWLSLIGRSLPFIFFILLAVGGMFAVYVVFSPPDGDDVISAIRTESLSNYFFKAVPAEPVSQRLAQSPGPIRVGIISGHVGYDTGAVCADGLREDEINTDIANKVIRNLQQEGIRTELLEEFDEKLMGFNGTALVSIHADSCDFYNDSATGFKIAGSFVTDSSLLFNCLENAYQQVTGLPYSEETITIDMTNYHAFYDIAEGTPAVIIETGFMQMDRELLTTNSDIPAEGISRGILCFMNNR